MVRGQVLYAQVTLIFYLRSVREMREEDITEDEMFEGAMILFLKTLTQRKE